MAGSPPRLRLKAIPSVGWQRRHQSHRDQGPAIAAGPFADIALFRVHRHFHPRRTRLAHPKAGAKGAGFGARPTADLTVVYGVNHDKLTKDHYRTPERTCTTTAWRRSPRCSTDTVGIDKGFMTIHLAFLDDQPSPGSGAQDQGREQHDPDLDWRGESQSAWCRKAGRLDGVSIRVPTPNVRRIDVCRQRATSKDEINGAMKRAAEQQLKGNSTPTSRTSPATSTTIRTRSSTWTRPVMDGTFVR